MRLRAIRNQKFNRVVTVVFGTIGLLLALPAMILLGGIMLTFAVPACVICAIVYMTNLVINSTEKLACELLAKLKKERM